VARIHAARTEPSDEENTAFGLPEQVADQKPGFDREVAYQAGEEGEPGKNDRFRSSEERAIPQEPLAARIAARLAQSGKEG
jgi:hypothetical protein